MSRDHVDALSFQGSVFPSWYNEYVDMADVMDMFRLRRCSDDRDRIHAATGIYAPKSRVFPYYERSVEEAYINFARSLIQVEFGLKILSSCCSHSTSMAQLPSWVPD